MCQVVEMVAVAQAHLGSRTVLVARQVVAGIKLVSVVKLVSRQVATTVAIRL